MAVALNFALGLLWLVELPAYCYAAALVVPAVAMTAGTALSRGLATGAYIASATAAFVVGIGTYFESLTAAALIYLLIVGLTFTAGYGAGLIRRPWLATLALVLIVSVPPANFVVWPHPISTVGLVLPDLGFFGLTGAVVFLALAAGRPRHLAAAVVCLPILAFLVSLVNQPLAPPMQGVSFSSEMLTGSAYEQHQNLISQVFDTQSPRVLLPEMVTPDPWNEHACDLWRQRLSAQSDVVEIYLGTSVGPRTAYQNAVVRIDAHGCAQVSTQTMPIPIAMWRPFFTPSATIRSPHDPKVAGLMVCYDTTQIWVWLLELSQQPPALLHMANLWWAPSSVVHAQRILVRAWATLFQLPLTEAYVHD